MRNLRHLRSCETTPEGFQLGGYCTGLQKRLLFLALLSPFSIPMINLRFLLSSLTLAASAFSQVTYVDLDAATNTTLADGAAVTFGANHTAGDHLWFMRANGTSTLNGAGTCFGSNDSTVENSPMLRTTISGLTPGAQYDIYFYLWAHPTQLWRGRANVATSAPAPELTGYVTTGPSWSTDRRMKALANTSFTFPGETNLGLTYDATTRLETSGHFTNPVRIFEGAAYLFEGAIGRFAADANGEIWVYLDDHPNGGYNNRTWLDGVGYKPAPTNAGGGCGDATIDLVGQQMANMPWNVTLGNADANSLAILLIGFTSQAPVDIAAYGLTPGCLLTNSYFTGYFTVTDAMGASSFSGLIPSLSIPAVPFAFQWATLSTNVNEMSPTLVALFHN